MESEWIALALRSGARAAAGIEQRAIVYDRMFRDICANNACGNYGQCYMCPPDVGNIDELIRKLREYSRAVLFQTVTEIEDSFDYEGMQNAGRIHNAVSRRVFAALKECCADWLLLSAGGCRACERCAKKDGLPCRSPKEALASLEAHGIDVYHTAKNAGLPYINGVNTVTYFSMILYNT